MGPKINNKWREREDIELLYIEIDIERWEAKCDREIHLLHSETGRRQKRLTSTKMVKKEGCI